MRNIKKHILILCLTLISVIVLLNLFYFNDEGILAIHMIDVGQGDSILIITPSNKTILIDAAESHKGPDIVSYLNKNKVQTIDILIATHPHSDHIGGIPVVIENFKINNFYMPLVTHNTVAFNEMLTSIKHHDLKISSLPVGKRIEFDNDIFLYFISPLKDYGSHLNNWSVVLKLDYLHKSFLFTGDVEYKAELDIINSYDAHFLKSHLLKVAHHGSNSSSTEKFLNVIKPEVALISCGYENSYNHPHREILHRLEHMGISIYRTDLQGNIVIKSNGKEIWSNQRPYYYHN